MVSITLRIKPPPFQFGSAGWISPFVLVQRTCKLNIPDCGAMICALHWRKPYLPSSRPKVVGCESRPPSVDSSTRDTPLSPPNAIPLTGTGAPGLTIVSSLTLVKNERGTIRVTGTVLNPVSPGFTLACGVSGTRYPTASNQFSSGAFSTSISLSILIQESPYQPGTISRIGK